MKIIIPIHPNPADYESLDEYLQLMDTWWSHVMQEELPLLADRIPLMRIAWRARWLDEHFPRKP